MYSDNFIDDVIQELAKHEEVFCVAWADEIEPKIIDRSMIVFFRDGSIATILFEPENNLADMVKPGT